MQAVRQLAEYYNKPPDQINEEELRQYFLYLKNIKKVSRSTCCPKASSRCAISAFLLLVAANAWLLCANSSSRNAKRIWLRQNLHQS